MSTHDMFRTQVFVGGLFSSCGAEPGMELLGILGVLGIMGIQIPPCCNIYNI
jgi:hypothetical protein